MVEARRLVTGITDGKAPHPLSRSQSVHRAGIHRLKGRCVSLWRNLHHHNPYSVKHLGTLLKGNESVGKGEFSRLSRPQYPISPLELRVCGDSDAGASAMLDAPLARDGLSQARRSKVFWPGSACQWVQWAHRPSL